MSIKLKTFWGLAFICLLGPSSVSANPTNTTRIVGGYSQNITEVPWQVSFGDLSAGVQNNHQCGGSILDNKWIVTAAHCFFDAKGLSTSEHKLTIGETALSTAASSNQYSFTPATSVYIHPDFNSSTLDNDIALIQLPTAMDLTACGNKCEAIELVTPANEGNTAGLSADSWVSGWGGTVGYIADAEGLAPAGHAQLFPDILKELALTIVICPEELGTTENMICAGASNLSAEDSCQGDSGGPLSVQNNSGTGYLLAGVVSFGNGCAGGFAGAYTRISKYNDWISTRKANPTVLPADLSATSNNGPVPATAKSGGGAIGFSLFGILLGLAAFRKRTRKQG